MYAYCNNDPVNMIDPDGHAPKWWQWALSGAAVVGGVILCATGIGGVAGGALIAAGAGSLIGGYMNEANGGSFTAGYIGGAVTGALCAIGAGYAAPAFLAASKVLNSVAAITNLVLGVGYSFVGGMAGNYIGTSITNLIDGNNIELTAVLQDSVLLGTLNLISGLGGSVAEAFLKPVKYGMSVSTVLGKSVGVISVLTTETIYDTVSTLVAWLLSIF